MLNFAINNEAIQGSVPIPLLTKNLIYKGDKAMAESIISKTKTKKQPYNKPVEVGEQFGRLTAIKEIAPHFTPKKEKLRKVKLKCDCGNIVEAMLKDVRSGNTQSCGCLRGESITSHGFTHHPLYNIYSKMKYRCSNQNDKSYHDYGGRGIEVCKEWLDSPGSFIKWALKKGWHKGLLLDRKRVDCGYDPSNCRFVNGGLSARNKRLLYANNTSGFRGVSFNNQHKKWHSEISNDGKKYNIGYYANPAEAAFAYDAKAKELNAEHPRNFSS